MKVLSTLPDSQYDLFIPPEEALLGVSTEMEITDEHHELFRLISGNTRVIHLNGEAGTGKTLLVQHIQKKTKRNVVVVAPTGVAALNVGGATIHSFFHFPPRIVTDEDIKIFRKQLIEALSLLIIDEISMVRADTLDAIDKFLRKNRESAEPFGGVQVLVVGDLLQLPPVVTPKEWQALKLMGYKSPYFFSAKVFEQCPLVTHNLTKIYRQSDPQFVGLLNKIRIAEDLPNVLPVINERCLEPNPEETIITLTSTNRLADEVNYERLAGIPSPAFTFTGEATGKFLLDETKLPSPMNLILKVGAQVMFTKNDSSSRRWVNGTLGKVVELGQTSIKVEVRDEYGTNVYDVGQGKWESIQYTFDFTERKVNPEVIGTFVQYPLMLAWAVTIHKGQGKTLDRVKIDIGAGAFAHGQVYVALSRCRSLENIYLVNPITAQDVKCDPAVKRFYAKLTHN